MAASRTAEYMALFRALESARPRRSRLFEDPFARRFLRPSLRTVVVLSRVPGAGRAVPAFIDRRWPGARASGVARTRLIDDALAAALAAGARQVAILGAGFDCRAYRMPSLRRARVFEVDQAGTQRAKRERLGAIDAGHVAFVEVDFTRQSVDDALTEAGFDAAAPAFFVWEGVTNYLTAEAVDATLRAVVRIAAPGSGIVFTYIDPSVLSDPAAFEGAERTASIVEGGGESWSFGIDPSELRGYLAERGLDLVEDIGSDEYRRRYMGPSGRHLRGYEFYRAARAELSGRRT